TSWVSSAGDFVTRFEQMFAKYIGVRYAVATSSGTAGLHLALAALDIGPEDEVILPTFTMIATLLPILYVGAAPILVDVDRETGNIDIKKIQEKITRKTKAIIPVHMFGSPVNMTPLLSLAKKHNLFVIEDAAEAHGAEYRLQNTWKKTGSLGNIGCFSFYGNKLITTGEGGMAVTNNKKLADRMQSLRNLARTPGKHFLHTELAYAYRMSNLQAALGVAELEEIADYIQRKKELAETYNKHLSSFSHFPIEQSFAKSMYWQYGLLLKNRQEKESLATTLERKGIETRAFFTPLHLQPMAKKLKLFRNDRYPVSEMLCKQGLCIPSGVGLSHKDQMYVIRQLLSLT
ncbi:MAG: DegT/DnrJ/EryC1/StrS family aminotransferase, partial [Patescibacteria group bacterium]|nr:DegT/DnrJ/EryC1/StrS family aminotransferase [Patescibacteria group bacterium]